VGPVDAPTALRKRSLRLVGVVLVVVAALASLFAFGLRRDPTVIRSVLVGRRAPNFALQKMDGGGTMRLSGLRGQVVVLNFWASWCTACRLEHPNFLAAWQRYRDSGVVFIGIVFEDTASNARAYMRELSGDWPNLLDPASATAQRYGVYGVPETFFIGKDGIVHYKQIGYTSYDLLSGEVERLLNVGGAGGTPSPPPQG